VKRLLLIPLLLLSACAPALQAAQQEQASLTRDGAAVVFQNPGPDAAQSPSVLIVGSGPISVTETHCQQRSPERIGCVLPDLEPGQQYRVTVTGVVKTASVAFYRASAGIRPIYLELP